MTTRVTCWLFAFLLLSNPLRAQQVVLRGEVLLVDENGITRPAAGVEVTVRDTGGSDVADGKGLFRITLPQGFKPGREITVGVTKQGWAIWQPLEGRSPIPEGLLSIRLLPKGSKKFWTDRFIQTFIEGTAEKAKLQVQLADKQEKPKPVDFGPMIKEWAGKYGFSPEEAKEQIEKWIAEVQQARGDFYKLGLAAFADHNFGRASELFSEAGRESEKQLAALEKQQAELAAKRGRLVEETVRNYRKAGDAHYSDYAFAEALDSYQKALSFVEREQQPELWAEVQVDVGRASQELGGRTRGPAIHQYLAQAVAAYRAALEVYTREQLPQHWATTQNNLGSALQEQGDPYQRRGRSATADRGGGGLPRRPGGLYPGAVAAILGGDAEQSGDRSPRARDTYGRRGGPAIAGTGGGGLPRRAGGPDPGAVAARLGA